MRSLWAVMFVLLALACRPDDQKTSTIDAGAVKDARATLPPELVMHLDSGNAAYRRKDYANARLHYEAATRIDDRQPAGWFGIYMVELATGDTAAAQRALRRAQKLVPGATLIHPGDTSK